MANITFGRARPDLRRLSRWSLAGALLCGAGHCAAAFGVGYLAECATFTT